MHGDFNGCSIYTDRPISCQKYECHWLRGYMPDEMRPDLSGFVLDFDMERVTHYVFYTAGEAYPGAFKDEKVLYRLKKLCKFLDEPVIAHGVGMLVPAKLKWRNKLKHVFGGDLETIFV